MTTVPESNPDAKKPEADVKPIVPEAQKPEPEASKKLTAEDVDEPIPHASREVYWHTEKKGVQLFSLVTMAVSPLVVYWRGARGMDVIMRAGRATAIGSFLVGPLFGWTACYMVLRKQEPIAIYDRAYRLRYSKLQNRTDQFSEIGAAVGAGLGAALLKPRLQGGIYGAAFGVGLGVILHVLTTPKDK